MGYVGPVFLRHLGLSMEVAIEEFAVQCEHAMAESEKKAQESVGRWVDGVVEPPPASQVTTDSSHGIGLVPMAPCPRTGHCLLHCGQWPPTDQHLHCNS